MITGHFEVTYLSTSSDTVLAIDRSAEVSAFGAGSLDFEPDQIVLAGQRMVRSNGAVIAAGVMAIGAGFLVAVMWQGERWPPELLAIVAALVAGCAYLFVRAKRVEPFRWVVPWRDVSSFTEMRDSGEEWLATVKRRRVGTLPFAVLGGRGAELTDVMIRVHESGLAKVRFRTRELPEAAIVRR